MQILFLTPAFPPFPGGGERYVDSLACELSLREHHVTIVTSLAEREHDFWQGVVENESLVEHLDGMDIVRCSVGAFLGGKRSLLAWRKLMVLVSSLPGEQTAVLSKMSRQIPPIKNLPETLIQLDRSFDIVHAFNISWEHPMMVGWEYAQRHQIPFVATPYMHFGVKGADRVARNSTMDHQRAMLNAADRILTLTQIEREGLVSLGMSPEKVDVIWGAVAREDEWKTAVSPPKIPPTPYAIYVGRASFDKGAIHAAQAIIDLRTQGENISLVLVGQMTNEFQTFFDKLSPTEQAGIQHQGICSDVEKHALMDKAELLLLPSRTDSFGLVLLEAWIHGIPVIGARAGGIPGVIDEGIDGQLVEFGDVAGLATAIRELVNDESLRCALGEAGKKKVEEKFTWEKVGKRVLQNYEELLDK